MEEVKLFILEWLIHWSNLFQSIIGILSLNFINRNCGHNFLQKKWNYHYNIIKRKRDDETLKKWQQDSGGLHG